ncbi:MAG: hypothetical protein JWP59_2729, partial [Massilia sp.]|nr:hypothetical protein [Massilia sp.]
MFPSTPSATGQPRSTQAQRAAPAARWRLRQAEGLAVVVFAVALAATWSLWRVAEQQVERNRQAEFDFQGRRTVRSIEQRMATYEQVERDTQAFLLGSMDVKHEDFKLFVAAIGLQQRFPGIQGLALVRLVPAAALDAHVASVRASGADGAAGYAVKPAGPRPLYSAITHIEPFTGLNLRALGFDMLSDPTRRAAMERARDSGAAAASGKVRLIQENGRNVQSGFVMYIPVYRRGATAATVEQRRASLAGWVGAPFRMDDLMAGLGGERSAEVTLTIYDGAEIKPEAQLYGADTEGRQPAAFKPRFSSLQRIDVAGQRWTLAIASTPQLEARIPSNGAAWIAVGGIAASTLLAMLVLTLGSGKRRALNLATAMTEQLRESEFRWKYALEGAGDGVWDWDRGSDAAIYSKQWKAMLGYGEHEVPNSTLAWQELLHPDDAARVQATLDDYVEKRSPAYACEYRMRARDGGYRWILGRGMAVTFDQDGRPLRIIGTHTDISRAKENENAMRVVNAQLAHQQHRFNIILQHSHDAFVAIGADGIITDWNASAERMFGWSAVEAVGRPLAELIIPPDQRARHHAGFARFIERGHGNVLDKVIEVTALHRSGRLLPAELAVAGFPEGSQFAVSAFIRDVSERKAAERSAAERSQALDDARQALNHAQKLEAVGKLTGGIAHDFNNVLQIINGNVQLLQQFPPTTAVLQQRLSSIGAAVGRGAKLSSQLLAFARRQPLQPTAVEPLRILRDRDDLLQRALGEQITVEYRHDAVLWNVFVDAGQLENVFLNLALNARDAMPSGGTFVVDIRNTVLTLSETRGIADISPGDYVLVAISDSGSGMTEDVMAHAFEPFFTTKPVGQGTGLGLSMAYGFVKQSGGHIRLASVPGQGTTIEIFLPRSTLAPVPAMVAAAPLALDGGDETILVVEDDDDVRSSVVGTLQGLGYRVQGAADGAAGLAA